jgi:hypothetical protein
MCRILPMLVVDSCCHFERKRTRISQPRPPSGEGWPRLVAQPVDSALGGCRLELTKLIEETQCWPSKLGDYRER